MQLNSSLNNQESILALTQATKEQRVQELSLSVTRMSPNGVCVQEGGIGNMRKNIYLLRTQSTKVSHLVFFCNLILTRPQTTSQVQVNLIHSFFNILSTHAMDERKHES